MEPQGRGGEELYYYFSLLPPAKNGIGFTLPFWTSLFQFLGQWSEILDLPRANQRKSESLYMNFKAIPRYASQQA